LKVAAVAKFGATPEDRTRLRIRFASPPKPKAESADDGWLDDIRIL
jgi:hypothetical protein